MAKRIHVFSKYFELAPIRIFKTPINFNLPKFYDDHKIFGIVLIIILILLGFIGAYYLFAPKRVNADPHLNFISEGYPIKFTYFDLKYKKIPNIGIKDSVNLNEVVRIEFNIYIKNDSDIDIIYSAKINKIKLSNGQFLIIEPFINNGDFWLGRGNAIELSVNGIVAKYLLSELEKDESFYLEFQPEIEYYPENKKDVKKYFDKVIRCSNSYKKSVLPLYKPSCNILKNNN